MAGATAFWTAFLTTPLSTFKTKSMSQLLHAPVLVSQ
jgi:hypothetical protein